MLEALGTQTLDTQTAQAQTAHDAVLVSSSLLDRLHNEIKFKQIKIDALTLELARLKRWRFGASSESLEQGVQGVLFDAIAADTALEDLAAAEASKPESAPAAPAAPKRQAVRMALPAHLPRTDRHYEITETHCNCGQPLRRFDQEVSEQLDSAL